MNDVAQVKASEREIRVVKWNGDPPDPEPADPTSHASCDEVLVLTFENDRLVSESVWRNPNASR